MQRAKKEVKMCTESESPILHFVLCLDIVVFSTFVSQS